MQSSTIKQFLALIPHATLVEDIEGACLAVPIGWWRPNRVALIILTKWGSLARTYAVLCPHNATGTVTLRSPLMRRSGMYSWRWRPAHLLPAQEA
jgi:hypothetical protein